MENTRCSVVIVRLEQAVRKVFVDVVQNLQRALDWLLNDFFSEFFLTFYFVAQHLASLDNSLPRPLYSKEELINL